MTDLFVSYKSQDRERVKPLVDALQADGINLWWDAHIAGGDAWRDAIERHLDLARCVLVVWSVASTGPEGRFVRDEATRAQRRNAYLPVRIDAVEPPLGFGEIQALPLIGWKGDRQDPRYQAVLTAARAVIDGKPPAASVYLPAGEKPHLDRRLVLAGGGVATLAAVGVGSWALWPTAPSKDTSIAVLPFANLSGDPGQAYFADGIAEELRSALTRIPQFSVIGRSSSDVVRDQDARTAAAKLGVASILTGSVRRSPSMIRIAAQLINGKDGVERWSETFDRPPGDALEIQSAIAQSVAQALSVRLLPAVKEALTSGGTRNPDAHDLNLQAQNALTTDDSADGFARSLALTESALKLDPQYGEALAMRALLLTFSAGNASSIEDLQRYNSMATVAARLAVAQAPRLGLARRALAEALLNTLDIAGARRAYEQGVSYGAEPVCLRGQSQFLGGLGETDAALAALDRAARLDPLAGTNLSIRAAILFNGRRYADAIAAARQSLAVKPKVGIARNPLCWALIMLGHYREALEVTPPGSPRAFNQMLTEAIALWRLGDHAGSDARLTELHRTYGDSASYQYTQVHAQRGESDIACAMLERALALRDPGLISIYSDPFLDPIRNQPRFQAVVKALGPTR